MACFGPLKRGGAAKDWDKNRPGTLRHIYMHTATMNTYSAEEFEIYRGEFIRQADLRLAYLREIEGKRMGRTPVTGSDVEDMRARILQKVQRSAELERDETYVERHFNGKQRQALYNLLVEIAETIPWKFPWWEGMEAVHRHHRRMAGYR